MTSRENTASTRNTAIHAASGLVFSSGAALGAAAIDPVLVLPLSAFCGMALVTVHMGRRLFQDFSAASSG